MLRSRRGTILLQLFFATAVALIIAVGLVSVAFVRSYARTVEQLVLLDDLPRAMAELAAGPGRRRFGFQRSSRRASR
jgi:hypothetical protein